jgi:hypothetical protein
MITGQQTGMNKLQHASNKMITSRLQNVYCQ